LYFRVYPFDCDINLHLPRCYIATIYAEESLCISRITTDSITVSTVHSLKGFDYAAVFVLGLDLLDQSRWTEEQVNCLTYVAITRARFRLYIPDLTENQVVKKLLSCR